MREQWSILQVDFVCSGIDIMGCGHLCSQLISKLNLPT